MSVFDSIVKETAQFYPTPPELVKKMLDGFELHKVNTVLEPSAGKGDILRILASEDYSYQNSQLDVDCIEFDNNLRQILRYNFSQERKDEILRRIRDIKDLRTYDWKSNKYNEIPPDKSAELKLLEEEEKTFFGNGIHIVYNDFLSFETLKHYDLIIMNPPFLNGDRHLLKALDLQKNGGCIICILNAETLKNPYTETRKFLVSLLEKYNADIEYISNAFTSAERKTDVEIALIKVYIPTVVEESDIYNRFKKAEKLDEDISEVTDLEITDYIKAAVNLFNVESKAGADLIRQYNAFVPYMSTSFNSTYETPILILTGSYEHGNDRITINEFLRRVRLKYWRALLSNPKYTGRLTTKLQEEYGRMVERLQDYDFNEFNIYTLSADMNARIKSGIEDEIIVMFDRLTEAHTWYPETQKNRHYYNGWATNKAHKIDKKVIIPCYGVFSSWTGKPDVYNANGTLSDIERILNYFDGNMTADVDLWETIKTSFDKGITKKIPCKFFEATFYKKGTVHITFTCPKLIERFNIYAGQYKKWLPPSYGKKKYKDMTTEEKTVIDEFQGEQAYDEVLKESSYYLAPVTTSHPLLAAEVTENV